MFKKTFVICILLPTLYLSACNDKANDTITKTFPTIPNKDNFEVNKYLQINILVDHGEATNHVRVYSLVKGQGEYVTILPSLGRGVEDFTEEYKSTITSRLVKSGYQVILIQPRGIGHSTGNLILADASMSMFAQDIIKTFQKLGIEKANFIGHAFGNRLARTIATLYPKSVDKLVLMASGGEEDLNQTQRKCLLNSFNSFLSRQKRLDAIHCAFFARENDPSVWYTGWYPILALAQINAVQKINGDFFKKAGGKDFLIIQAAEDFIAPPELTGQKLKQELGEQVVYVEIPRTGHALSSEEPDLISDYIIDYFKGTLK
ncbi:alpha/beta hydrolase [Acinetobacter gyllenbergii]|uniref:alpha/beta fold hydrolase n=1 Tax=Acinetobacter gyllenbergii TaxID=134534 RepID=UPI0021D188EE|nr:alpha/beta hydrolase [Acinetobacter gyllenbergii]MCU4581250.1 alpha/beta hydrolase [Acinetobacter gyllenbergii]